MTLDRSTRLHIRHIPGQPVTYLQNPKVATRTIESALWDAHAPGEAPDNPHGITDGPFLRPGELTDCPAMLGTEFFTVVRNPYTRFLSAYISKAEKPQTWHKISRRFEMTPDDHPSVTELLRAALALDPAALDHHFRPQHLNVLHGLAPLGFVGHIEVMGRVEDYLSGHGVTLPQVPRAYDTGASGLVAERLDDTARELIRDLYFEDFRLFGYSDDWRQAAPVHEPSPGAGTRETLREVLVTPAHCANPRSIRS